MEKKYKILIIILILLIGIFYYLIFIKEDISKTALVANLPNIGYPDQVEVNGRLLNVFTPKTPESAQKGLSVYDGLNEDQGMLYMFNHSSNWMFTMKGMTFGVDIIWILDDKVAGCSENLPFESGRDQEVIHQPPYPVNRVLEVNAGYCRDNGIKRGQPVKYYRITKVNKES